MNSNNFLYTYNDFIYKNDVKQAETNQQQKQLKIGIRILQVTTKRRHTIYQQKTNSLLKSTIRGAKAREIDFATGFSCRFCCCCNIRRRSNTTKHVRKKSIAERKIMIEGT